MKLSGIGFIFEVSSFFYSGVCFAKLRLVEFFIFFVIGVVLALLTGKQIIKENKEENKQ